MLFTRSRSFRIKKTKGVFGSTFETNFKDTTAKSESNMLFMRQISQTLQIPVHTNNIVAHSTLPSRWLLKVGPKLPAAIDKSYCFVPKIDRNRAKPHATPIDRLEETSWLLALRLCCPAPPIGCLADSNWLVHPSPIRPRPASLSTQASRELIRPRRTYPSRR
jgi:hypothetical protein